MGKLEGKLQILIKIRCLRFLFTFQRTYRRSYASPKEEIHRYTLFMGNNDKIKTHNEQFVLGNVTYELKVNEFADYTVPEFAARYHGKLKLDALSNIRKAGRNVYTAAQSLLSNVFITPALSLVYPNEEEVDWRKMGAVTPVKNQGESKVNARTHLGSQC